MNKTLLTNGCSFTWGGGLTYTNSEERWPNVWPGILSKGIGYTDVNLSAGCGSNARIFRTTHDWITSQDPETLANTFAIIQLTEPSRYEFYQPYWREWSKIKVDITQVSATSNDEEEYLTELAQKRFEYYTQEEGKYLFLSYLCALKTLFDTHGVPHVFFTYSHIEIDDRTFVDQNFNWVNNAMEQSDFYNMSIDNWGIKFRNARRQWDTIPNDGHLSLDGHKEFAEYLERKLCFQA